MEWSGHLARKKEKKIGQQKQLFGKVGEKGGKQKTEVKGWIS